MRYDTIIIGAGLSGLAAGIRLAHYNKKTLILERHYRIGGLNSYYKAGGYDLDVGLHAITNYAPAGPKSGPLKRLLRRLRLTYDDLGLSPQKSSRIVFPDAALQFSNDIEFIESQIRDQFPDQIDNFRALANKVTNLYEKGFVTEKASAREVLASIITKPYLVEILLCPMMYYGSPSEHDMEFRLFAILFYSIFIEGLARPRDGITHILNLLISRYEESGGELRTRAGVSRINTSNGKVTGAILDSGEVIECDNILSSAGHAETAQMCPSVNLNGVAPEAGGMSFVESINILDRPAVELGLDDSIIFYNNSERFDYRTPGEPVDLSSGVICVPGNFSYNTPLENDMIRVTHMANPAYWENADDDEYYDSKATWHKRSVDVAEKVCTEFQNNIKFYDMFTPRTIKRFTGHLNGAVYGAPDKVWDGLTPVENLYICGTDQGFSGVTGAMIGGVELVNRRLLS